VDVDDDPGREGDRVALRRVEREAQLPISFTIGDAEMFSAVSRAVTRPPRSREKIFSKRIGSPSRIGSASRPQ
jgi:hypothetical protein